MTEWTGTIIMKSNRIGYYIKEGISSIFTHGFMSFASVFIIIACLIIMGSFSLIVVNVDTMIERFEDENIVLAFVADGLSDDQVMALKGQIEKLDNVASVEFISRDAAMENFVSRYDNTSMFDGIEADTLAHRYAVYMNDISLVGQTQASLLKIDGIERVKANADVAKKLVTIRNVVSGASLAIIAILLVISLFIMSNTIKLATFERREEIAIMRMVGATKSFIRWPFVLEGFILGEFGAGVAYFAQWGLYNLLLTKVVGAYTINFISFVPFSTVAMPMLVVFLAIGFLVGVCGSAMAIKNYLKV